MRSDTKISFRYKVKKYWLLDPLKLSPVIPDYLVKLFPNIHCSVSTRSAFPRK
jgi:hypothetical protein